MKIVVRTDSSIEIGSGHLMRCLTLADQLRARGGAVSFISRNLTGNVSHLVEEKGYTVHRLAAPQEKSLERLGEPAHSGWLKIDWQTDAEETKQILREVEHPVDWLVVDHYALDNRWETQMRPFAARIMVIDDIADRPHDCDLLLDQNLYRNMETRYDGLLPTHCKKLLGPAYALLRPEFTEARKSLRKRDGSVKRILIFFGGSDPTNETAKALDAIMMLNRPEIAVDVVVGHANQHKDQIRQMCAVRLNTTFHCQVDNMATLMALADLAIGAGGTSTWERCFLGLPALTVILADNQAETTEALSAIGASWSLGRYNKVRSADLVRAVETLFDEPVRLVQAGEIALSISANVSCDNMLLRILLEKSHAKT